MAANALTVKEKINLLKNVMSEESVVTQFNNALKGNSGPFIASVIDLYNNDSKLQECKPKAVVMEALKGAILNLPINKNLGFAYLVPFNNKVKEEVFDQKTGAVTIQDHWIKVPTFIIGWKGFVQLAMRTGYYKYLNADAVYEGELKEVNKLTGEIAFDGKKTSDKIIGYFCYFQLINGFSKTLYMTVEQLAKYAKKYSKSLPSSTTVTQLISLANSEPSGAIGWTGNFQAMALKTVVRRLLSQYGYLSIEMQNALSTEDEDNISEDNQPTQQQPKTQPVNIENIPFEVVDGDGNANANANNSQEEQNSEQIIEQAPKPSFA